MIELLPTVSIFKNKIFLEILKEIKIFSKYKIKYYEDLNLCIKESLNFNQIIFFFLNEENEKDCNVIMEKNVPIIIFYKNKKFKNFFRSNLVEKLNLPIKLIDVEKKIVSLLAKNIFYKSSLINLRGYIIDKNERKIKKNNIELQLTEKEINFLILFSKNSEPVTRNFVLKKVWNYSSKSDTHTVETHIHRLRKKIMEKFNDNNFIKNNNKGYYI
tara:strand:+ start:65 stop:709 length:645 start_codon:yes stop_codon:yes gene_type:complete